MPRNPDDYEQAKCPRCRGTVWISKATLARATSFQVQCEGCRLWLKPTVTNVDEVGNTAVDRTGNTEINPNVGIAA